ncbi:siroheme synthase CysG [Thioalkalivibrio halophilus]|uniref:Siroheme synthase n=1 Tax=Thioalkalivibrio halophilus TaxID=252474 RepID=A0A1V3A1G0_9GAMM|nr:siroheme synthase CysG [Thioalkalivibrio halophilus]OOC11171.1 uroporphyrinogen-III C-methyltransferase [Thioalkalivibrio halophilus]
MDFFPIFMRIRDRSCLVVGGGVVAARKIDLLRKAGGRVTVVSPELCLELTALQSRGEIEHVERGFREDDIHGRVLVVAATDDQEVNRRVSQCGQQHGIAVNVVDQPDLCSFITPAMVDRSPLQIAISTGGTSPVLARLLRARIESLVPASYGRLATLVEGFRERAKRCIPNTELRRRFWERVLEGPVMELFLSGRERAAGETLDKALDAGVDARDTGGEVFLVGAGPGDPDLLTFRALRLMQRADVVVYDNLVSPAILELVRRDAERIYAGKKRNHHTLPQGDINDLLIRLAQEGKRVLRLKGGDPFIFGRGGEEVDRLMQHGIPFQLVPGITAAAGCASFAGIPLTHRDHAQALVFATGHLQDGTIDLNWDMLAQPHQTVVFYMGLSGLPIICREMAAHGLPASTPAALVEQGTTQNQRVLVGTLETLPDIVKGEEVQPPTLIIVGSVVALQQRLQWFRPDAPPTRGSLFASCTTPETRGATGTAEQAG